jgi:hypothetical protein
MGSTESSAVVRLINSVQAQPILDSFHEPIRDPEMAPLMPALSEGTGTVIVRSRKRWPLYLFGAMAFLGAAAGIGYAIGSSGESSVPPPQQPMAAAAPMAAAPAVAEKTEAEATPALAEAPPVEPTVAAAPIVAEPEAAQAFDAAFDIIVEPAGATVFLDSKELGPAPLRIGRLAAGAHTVEITAPEGYESQSLELELEAGKREVVRVELDRVAAEEPAVTGIVSEPIPEKSSKRRAWRKESRTEKRVAKRAKPEKKRSRKSRSSKKSRSSEKSSKAAASGGAGTLMIGSKPPCKIYVDGRNTGKMTPQRALKLSAGKHKITLGNGDHGIRTTTTVTIEPGKTKRLIKDMSSRL